MRHAVVAIVRDERGAVLLETRPPSGIWGGLVSLPEFDAEADDDALLEAIARRFALRVELEERLADVRHEFSHFSLVMQPRVAGLRSALGAASAAAQWLMPDALSGAALPAPVRRLLQKECGRAA